MPLLVGLGNPGPEYADTRHNLGFRVVEAVAARRGMRLNRHQHQALVGRQADTILAKPLTFMNLSGRSVKGLLHEIDHELEALVVAYDDVDLPLGTIRLRPAGGSGGHQGMASIIQALGTDQIRRMRLGIDRPAPRVETADYVLQPFRKGEREAVAAMVEAAGDAWELVERHGFPEAMHRVNAQYGKATNEREERD